MRDFALNLLTFVLLAVGAVILFGCWSVLFLAASYIGGYCFPDQPANLCRQNFGAYIVSGDWLLTAVVLLAILVVVIVIAMVRANRHEDKPRSRGGM